MNERDSRRITIVTGAGRASYPIYADSPFAARPEFVSSSITGSAFRAFTDLPQSLRHGDDQYNSGNTRENDTKFDTR